MSQTVSTLDIDLEPADNRRIADLCGALDENLKHIERRLGIEISYRHNEFRLIGPNHTVQAGAKILRDLYVETATVKGE